MVENPPWTPRISPPRSLVIYRPCMVLSQLTPTWLRKGAAVLPPEPSDLARLKKMSAEILKAKLERDRRERELPESQWRRDRERASDERRDAVTPMIRELAELPIL